MYSTTGNTGRIVFQIIFNSVIFSGLEQRPVTHSELMSGVKAFINSVNIARSSELYLVSEPRLL